jgi:hypothetical protein
MVNSVRLSLPSAAASSVMIIVNAIPVFIGYQHGLTPLLPIMSEISKAIVLPGSVALSWLVATLCSDIAKGALIKAIYPYGQEHLTSMLSSRYEDSTPQKRAAIQSRMLALWDHGIPTSLEERVSPRESLVVRKQLAALLLAGLHDVPSLKRGRDKASSYRILTGGVLVFLLITVVDIIGFALSPTLVEPLGLTLKLFAIALGLLAFFACGMRSSDRDYHDQVINYFAFTHINQLRKDLRAVEEQTKKEKPKDNDDLDGNIGGIESAAIAT